MLDLRLWQGIKFAILALAIVAGIAVAHTIRYRRENHGLLQTIAAQGRELERERLQMEQTAQMLAGAEKKLGFLSRRTRVEATAFIGHGSFANGGRTEASYAVPTRHLPENRVLSIALSPPARSLLHARMNDLIVLFDPALQTARLARFVDLTSADEPRPVVDIFFASAEEAQRFGRQHFEAVNLSAENSPFR